MLLPRTVNCKDFEKQRRLIHADGGAQLPLELEKSTWGFINTNAFQVRLSETLYKG